MRPLDRIPKILAKLEQLWARCPDMRFGQLIDNIAVHDGWSGAGALFNVEDEDFEKVLDEILEKGWIKFSCTL